jgi:hypothetical protein
MDNKVTTTPIKQHGDFMFQIIKNIIIQENKVLLQRIAKKYKKNEEDFIKQYLKPEYYLPVILPDQLLKDA